MRNLIPSYFFGRLIPVLMLFVFPLNSLALEPAPTLTNTKFCTKLGTPFGENDRPNIESSKSSGNFIWYRPNGTKIGGQPFSFIQQSKPTLAQLGLDTLKTPGSYTYKVRIENAGGTKISEDAEVTYVVIPDLSAVDLKITTLNGQLSDEIPNEVCINSTAEFNSNLVFSDEVINLLEPEFTISGTVTGNIFLCIFFGIDCPRSVEIKKNEYPLNLSNLKSELEPGVLYTIDLKVKDCDGFIKPSSNMISFNLVNAPTSDILFPDIIYCPNTGIEFTVPIQPQFRPDNGFNYTLNFGDGSQPINIDPSSTLVENPETGFFEFKTPPHLYQKSGEYNLLLSAVDLNPSGGCNFNWAKSIRIGNPERFIPEFAVKNLRVGDPKGTDFELNNDSTLLYVNKTWLFGFDGNDGDTNPDFEVRVPSDTRPVNYHYDQAGTYTLSLSLDPQNVSLGATNFLICEESYLTNLTIYEHIDGLSGENPYEANANDYEGWIPSQMSRLGEVFLVSNASTPSADTVLIRAPINKSASWKLASVQEADNFYLLDSEKKQAFKEAFLENTWITQGANNYANPGEISWVETPFISLENFKNPFVTFKLWYDTPRLVNGAVFQYTLGNDETWQTLGKVEDIDNNPYWYNERGISSSPGTQDSTGNNESRLGWSGFSEGWKQMRFSLNEIKSNLESYDLEDQFVRFRMAYSSLSDSSTLSLIALQDFKILDADRIVLLEHFAGSEETSMEERDSLQILLQNDPFALQLNYYTDPSLDSLYRNSSLESAIGALQELYYGVGDPEFTVMDGSRGKLENLLKDFPQRKLDFTPYRLKLLTGANTLNLINFEVEKKTETLFLHEHRVRMALVKRGVKYQGKIYQNVVKRFLPFPQGIPLPDGLQVGDTFSLPSYLPWPADLRREDIGDPSIDNFPYLVVVFIQDIETKEILQTAVDTLSNNEIYGKEGSQTQEPTDESSIRIFPNPADDYVVIHTGLEKLNRWELRNTWGKLLASSKIDSLQKSSAHTILLDTHKIPSGCYLLVLEGQYPAKIIKKLMVVH